MRYLITFRSIGEGQKRTKKVSQKIGEQFVKSLASNQNIVVNGDWYNSSDIESVRKINTDNGFTKDYMLQQQRAELDSPDERKYLEMTKSPQLLGLPNAKFY